VFVFAFFTPAITPPFAAHWSDSQPGLEVTSKTAPVAPSNFRRCHGFCVHQVFNALPRTARCLPISEASSKRQGDGQRFQKKL
jgi:hypothetical protein